MDASGRLLRGVTFVEVMTSVACLALVSASLVGGLAFAAERTEIARQRAMVAAYLTERAQVVVKWRKADPSYTDDETMGDSVPGLGYTIQTRQAIIPDSTKPGLVSLILTGSWQSRSGERWHTESVSITTKFYENPPTPASVCRIMVSGKAGYLQQSPTPTPVVLDLSAYGLLPGTSISLKATGSYQTGAGSSSNLVALFAIEREVLAPAALTHRVPFAIEAGTDINTTSSSGISQDYPEDFQIGASALILTIPTGARFLVVGVPDTPGDNSGQIQLEVVKA